MKLHAAMREANEAGLRTARWKSTLTLALDHWLQAVVDGRDSDVVEKATKAVTTIVAEEDVAPPPALGDAQLKLLLWRNATRSVHVAAERANQALVGQVATPLLHEAAGFAHVALQSLLEAQLPATPEKLASWLKLEEALVERTQGDRSLVQVTKILEGFSLLLLTGAKAGVSETFLATCADHIQRSALRLEEATEGSNLIGELNRVVKALKPLLELSEQNGSQSPQIRDCFGVAQRAVAKVQRRRELLLALGAEIRAAMGDIKALRSLLLKAERLCVKDLPELKLAQQDVTISDFEIVDSRGGQSGKIQISLMWTNVAEPTDLDLFLYHPQGRVYYKEKKKLGSMFELDIDDRGQANGVESCENVFWPASSAVDPPVGWHEVKVVHFKGPPVDCRVALKLGAARTVISFPKEAVPVRDETQKTSDFLLACKFHLNSGLGIEVEKPADVRLLTGDDLLRQLQVWLQDERMKESPETLEMLIGKGTQLYERFRSELTSQASTTMEQALTTASAQHVELLQLRARLADTTAELEELSEAVHEADRFDDWPESERAKAALEGRGKLARLLEDFGRSGVDQSAGVLARRSRQVLSGETRKDTQVAEVAVKLREVRGAAAVLKERLVAAESSVGVDRVSRKFAEASAGRLMLDTLLRSILLGEVVGDTLPTLIATINDADHFGVMGEEYDLACKRRVELSLREN